MRQLDVPKIDVVLIAGDDGGDRIALKVAEGGDNLVVLTPAQARAMATELITAVNRAEVKASLKTSPNMWRRSGTSAARAVEATTYVGESAPRLARAG